jgi:uncharacterized protein YjbI with pentapeptide repeats
MQAPLSRADVEWLLANSGSGHKNSVDSPKRTTPLDLRGADLRGISLRNLPLSYCLFGLGKDEWINASREQRDWAAAHLERAILNRATLEHAILRGAYLTEAQLDRVHMENADLYGVHLEDAVLDGIHAEGTIFEAGYLARARFAWASLEGADLSLAEMQGANLNNAHLEKAHLWRTHLEGAQLVRVHLEGGRLYQTYLTDAFVVGASMQGKVMAADDLVRIRRVQKDFPDVLMATDLRRSFFNTGTFLNEVKLGDSTRGFISVADIHWDGVNLSVLNWASVTMLGDERYARNPRKPDGTRKTKGERLQEFTNAVRANRQLSTEMRSQGLNEDADRFAYRGQLLQRIVLRRQRRFLRYVGSLVLWLIAGYGYKPLRSIFTYLLVVSSFALAYYVLRNNVHPPLDPLGAVVFSITSFHGRGFTPGENVLITNPLTVLAAIEAIIGLLIEITFIATFTQRFFAR